MVLGVLDGGFQRIPVKPFQGEFRPAVETAFQFAVRGHPDAAACVTEAMTDGRNQAHSSFGSWELIPPGHAAGFGLRQGGNTLQNRADGKEPILFPVGAGADGH